MPGDHFVAPPARYRRCRRDPPRRALKRRVSFSRRTGGRKQLRADIGTGGKEIRRGRIGPGTASIEPARSVAPARPSAGVPQKPAEASSRCKRSRSAQGPARARLRRIPRASVQLRDQQAAQRRENRSIAADRRERACIVEGCTDEAIRRPCHRQRLRVACHRDARNASTVTGFAITSAKSGGDQHASTRLVGAGGRCHSGRSCDGPSANESRQRLRTVEPGHARVEQQKIEPFASCPGDRLGAVMGELAGEPELRHALRRRSEALPDCRRRQGFTARHFAAMRVIKQNGVRATIVNRSKRGSCEGVVGGIGDPQYPSRADRRRSFRRLCVEDFPNGSPSRRSSLI